MFSVQGFFTFCLLLTGLNVSVTAVDTCKTAWFDDGDVSTDGDSELLPDLRKQHAARVCATPVGMEVQTVSGVQAELSRNSFHTYSPSEGLLCLHSQQTQRQCEDFRVLFTCSGQFCSGCRTRWFDHDDPTGNGDYEVLSDLLSVYSAEICADPIAVEVQTVSGEPPSSTGDVFLNYDATYGFACVNTDQDGKLCQDYKVRFTCPSEFCQVSEQCRTQRLSSDDPSGEGDVESMVHLMESFPGQVCKDAVGVQAKTLAGISADHTGDTFLFYDAAFGFACINDQQSGTQCEDYQVVLTCPSRFCQRCRTRWFNMDRPSGRGDYETLEQLHVLYPSEVCTQPVAIEAATVTGVPAHRTGDVFLIYDATEGFACVNAEQSNGRRCQDYRVRLTCPPTFCSA